jgi:hypothetical protein
MATKVRPSELVAAGAALRHVEKLGIEASDVAKVTLEGKELDAAAAAQALVEAESKPAPSKDGFVNRVVDRFEKTADAAKPRLEKNAFGRMILKVLSSDPETVMRTGTVTLELNNGASLAVPVKILDTTASKWLQRTSALVELAGIPISLLPFMPNIASGGMAIASGLASLFADAIGRRDLGGALRATAGKHVALTVTSVVPGLGEIIAAYSLLLDQSNLRRLNGPVTVEDVVSLGASPVPAT